jgi:hypothetical protein
VLAFGKGSATGTDFDDDTDLESVDIWRPERAKDLLPGIADYQPDEGGKALRFNKGKPEWSRLPWAEIEEVVKVLTASAHNKYLDDPAEDGGRGRPNWSKGNSYAMFWESAQRHLLAWLRGETTDAESGLPTLAHCIASVLFLMNWERRGVGVDDRRRALGEDDK